MSERENRRFEYRVITIDLSRESMQDGIDREAKSGWRVVQVIWSDNIRPSILFERPRLNSEEQRP